MVDQDADDAERGIELLKQFGFYCPLLGCTVLMQNPTRRDNLFRAMYDTQTNQVLIIIDEYGKE